MALDQSSAAEVTAPRLSALPVEQVASLLKHAGCQIIDAERILGDIAAGAPVNRDGTMNLISYGAWLARELARRESAHG